MALLGRRQIRFLAVPKCSLSKHGFWASGVRTGATADRAETRLLPRFLSSVLKRPSQEVRRELTSGERFSGFSASGQPTGLLQKPQETCHSARCLVRRRVRLVCELAEEVPPDTNGLQVGSSRPTKAELGNAGFLPARSTCCLSKQIRITGTNGTPGQTKISCCQIQALNGNAGI